MTNLGHKRTLWCRFCKLESEQWVDAVNEHKRVCTACWRRQGDGGRVDIQDGARMTDAPRRDSRPPSIPPPPMLPLHEAYVTRSEYERLLTRVSNLELTTIKLMGETPTVETPQ